MPDQPYRSPSEREPDEPPPDPRGSWVLQTWMSRRACPDCNVALFAAKKEGFRIDACGRCGGAWLDHATAEHAISTRSLVPALLADLASARAPQAPREVHVRFCPDCGAGLVTTPVRDAGRVIDVCAEHGAWFDPHEMRAVIEAMVRRRPPVVDPEVDRAIERAEALSGLREAAQSSHRADLGGHLLDALGELIDDFERDFNRRR